MSETTYTRDGKTFEKFDGKMNNAYNRPLDKNKFAEGKPVVSVLTYETEYERVTVFDEIPADERLSNDDILDVVNNKRKANARQKAMQTALDAAGVIKPTMEDDDELKIQSIMKGLIASKLYDEAGARAFARKAIGLDK